MSRAAEMCRPKWYRSIRITRPRNAGNRGHMVVRRGPRGNRMYTLGDRIETVKAGWSFVNP